MRLLIVVFAILTLALPAMPSSAQTIPPPVYLPVVQDGALDPNRGIVFGEPLRLDEDHPTISAVLATNTSASRASFGVKATYKRDGVIVAVATGYIARLWPRQQRAALLYASVAIPIDADSVRVDVDTYAGDQGSVDLGQVITVGDLYIPDNDFFPQVHVEVTNGDTVIRHPGIQVLFFTGVQLAGVAEGVVSDLYPGQTKTATLTLVGEANQAEYSVLIF
jgi:hypothetical protein